MPKKLNRHESFQEFQLPVEEQEVLLVRYMNIIKQWVRLCCAKTTGEIFAMKKLKKLLRDSHMTGQVKNVVQAQGINANQRSNGKKE
ncbi:hypothetical protein P8452_10280 [Trifolium repens]|nr:hypothetical protein P8452_10280 [Trifolium repens]